MNSMKVRITLQEEILGTLPGDKEVFRTFVATKAPDQSKVEEEVASIEELYEKGITVFPRNKDKQPCVYNYLIKGFFKNACKAMREADGSESKKLTAYKTKIDNLIFIEERLIPIQFDGEIGFCERPLRASTAQGERVALACSESIPAGATLEFTISSFKKEMMNYVVEWLDYGKYNGLGQWHNSGKGKFTWEDITNKE